jgi:hypothetical protein
MQILVVTVAFLLVIWQLNVNKFEVVNILFNQGADTTIKMGGEKTLLNLSEESKHAEISEALKSYILEEERSFWVTDRLTSHTSQPVAAHHNQVSVFHSNSHAAVTGKQTASTVLPPFSGELNVDRELKLSNDDFNSQSWSFINTNNYLPLINSKQRPPTPRLT